MPKPKAFQIFIDNRGMVDKLSNEEAGQLFKALFAHADGDDGPDLDRIVAVAAFPMMQQIDRDREKYEEKCEKNRRAGQKSAESRNERQQALTDVNECQQAPVFLIEINQDENKDKDKNNSANALNARAHEKQPDHVRETGQDFDNRADSILQLFRDICKGFIAPDKLTAYRRRLIYQAEVEGVDFKTLFEKAQASEFLTESDVPYGFDWVLEPKNRQKIIEGNYLKKAKPPDKKKHRGSMYSTEGASFDIEKYEKKGLFDD